MISSISKCACLATTAILLASTSVRSENDTGSKNSLRGLQTDSVRKQEAIIFPVCCGVDCFVYIRKNHPHRITFLLFNLLLLFLSLPERLAILDYWRRDNYAGPVPLLCCYEG